MHSNTFNLKLFFSSRRRAEGGSDNGAGAVTQSNRSGSAAGMMKMYSDDTPGLKV